MVSIRKKSDSKFKWLVEPRFVISLKKKDEEKLKLIKAYFGIGKLFFLREIIVTIIQFHL